MICTCSTVIGLFLKHKRMQNKETQRKFAFRIDKDPPYINRIENGKQSMSFKFLEKIMKAHNLTAFTLFTEVSQWVDTNKEIVEAVERNNNNKSTDKNPNQKR